MIKKKLFLFGCLVGMYNLCLQGMQKKDEVTPQEKVKFFDKTFAIQRKQAVCEPIYFETSMKRVVKKIEHIISLVMGSEQNVQQLPRTTKMQSRNASGSYNKSDSEMVIDTARKLSLIDSDARYVLSEGGSSTSSGNASPIGAMQFDGILMRDFTK